MRITFANQSEFRAFRDGELNNFCNGSETVREQTKHSEQHMGQIGDDLSLDTQELDIEDFPYITLFS